MTNIHKILEMSPEDFKASYILKAEFIEISGLTDKMFRTRAAKGDFEYFNIGNVRYYKRSDALAYNRIHNNQLLASKKEELDEFDLGDLYYIASFNMKPLDILNAIKTIEKGKDFIVPSLVDINLFNCKAIKVETTKYSIYLRVRSRDFTQYHAFDKEGNFIQFTSEQIRAFINLIVSKPLPLEWLNIGKSILTLLTKEYKQEYIVKGLLKGVKLKPKTLRKTGSPTVLYCDEYDTFCKFNRLKMNPSTLIQPVAVKTFKGILIFFDSLGNWSVFNVGKYSIDITYREVNEIVSVVSEIIKLKMIEYDYEFELDIKELKYVFND